MEDILGAHSLPQRRLFLSTSLGLYPAMGPRNGETVDTGAGAGAPLRS